jgi:S1-C subfamily serine protease
MKMDKRTVAGWGVAAVVLAVLGLALAPGLPGALALKAIAAQPAAVPTATAGVPAASYLADEEGAANALEGEVIAVYDAASPSVVNVTNRSTVYNRFFGASPQEGTGSGFVYDREGHILTNYHVIEGADELLVTLADGQVYTAKVVGSDPTNDLAVLQIEAGADMPEPLLLGDSGDLHVGQFVVAIGNPYGLQRTLTTGVVSALGRVIESPEQNQFIGEAIQTDAAINPGNSGGPMLDLRGRVIGVNSQIISPSGASAGIGFAVSANTVRRVAPELIARGYYPHPWLGVQPLSLSSSTVAMLRQSGVDLSADSGVLVLEADAGGPAEQAGLRGGDQYLRYGRYRLPVGGDVIVALNGEPIQGLEEMTVYLETKTQIGETIQVTVLRGGRELTLPVTLGEEPQYGIMANPCEGCEPSQGFFLGLLGAALGAEFGALGLGAARGTDAGRGPLDLGAALGAEFGAVGIFAAARADVGGGLGHERAALGAEFGAGRGQGAVFGAAGHGLGRLLGGLAGGLAGLLEDLPQAKGGGDALEGRAGLLGLGLGDLVAPGAVFAAVAARLVEIGQADDAQAGGALAETVLDLAPGLFDLFGGEAVGVAGVLTRDAAGGRPAHQGDFAQQAAQRLPADVLGDGGGGVGLAAIFTVAGFTVEDGVRPDAIVPHVIPRHSTWLCHCKRSFKNSHTYPCRIPLRRRPFPRTPSLGTGAGQVCTGELHEYLL